MTSTKDSATSERQQAARKVIDQTPEVPSFPEATERVRRLASDPDSTIEELAAALASDPALGAQLLKVANSAFYGLRASVSSIQHATVILGRNTVRSIAVAASLQTVFPKDSQHPLFSPRALWTHSIRTAGACAELSRLLDVADPDDAFVAGLIHDVGLLIEFQHSATLTLVFDGLANLPPAARRQGLRDLQLRHFGADHQDIGQVLLEAWGFPHALAQTAGHHHDPLAVEEPSRSLAALINAVESANSFGEHGLTEPTPAEPLDPEVRAVLGMTDEQFEEHTPLLLAAADALESAFSTGASAAA